jgi:PAS domain S-box-containing protein
MWRICVNFFTFLIGKSVNMHSENEKGDVTRDKEARVLELLITTSKVITSEVDLERLVQRITDLGTELTGAAFGAFFYNVQNPAGEKYVLYTISGVPKEAFSKFPMPRNTAIFNPTFTGERTVRYHDVTAEPNFGKNAPYYGHPKGHLPVKSYLAVPVVSSFDNEVLGGLFFGHPDAGVFTDESEKLIEGIAAQAAIAVANARLFEEKKQTEQKLLEQNALINTITNNTMHALLMMDEKHICTYLNPAAVLMIGYRLSDLTERPLHEFVHRAAQDGTRGPIGASPLGQALLSGKQIQGEDTFIHKSGRAFPVAFTASPIIEGGVTKGTVLEVRDISTEKILAEKLNEQEAIAKKKLEARVKTRTAELEKINYELLQFTSVASHDLKEPLRKISIFSKLLREKAGPLLDAQQTKYLNNIVLSAGRMTTLIDDLLMFSRYSHDNAPREPVDLQALVQQIVSDLEIAIAEKKATIHYSSLPTVMGMRLHLGQVFQNLISNSLKFSDPGRDPVITMSSRVIEKGKKKYHQIIYHDNGIGFDNSVAEKMFNLFERLDTKDNYEGTGIGLAIVKKIIALHSGTITAFGEPGAGARFEILLAGIV